MIHDSDAQPFPSERPHATLLNCALSVG